MIHHNTADVKEKINKQEELAMLLRILSMPSKIKSNDEHSQLIIRAKNLITEGYLGDDRIEEFMNKA